jgi:divalent metal cation (Fe/Co/Zn/Cd) transporter
VRVAFFLQWSPFIHPALDEIMDVVAPPNIESQVITIASEVDEVIAVENCIIHKSDLGFLIDIHVVINNLISIKNI